VKRRKKNHRRTKGGKLETDLVFISARQEGGLSGAESPFLEEKRANEIRITKNSWKEKGKSRNFFNRRSLLRAQERPVTNAKGRNRLKNADPELGGLLGKGEPSREGKVEIIKHHTAK